MKMHSPPEPISMRDCAYHATPLTHHQPPAAHPATIAPPAATAPKRSFPQPYVLHSEEILPFEPTCRPFWRFCTINSRASFSRKPSEDLAKSRNILRNCGSRAPVTA